MPYKDPERRKLAARERARRLDPAVHRARSRLFYRKHVDELSRLQRERYRADPEVRATKARYDKEYRSRPAVRLLRRLSERRRWIRHKERLSREFRDREHTPQGLRWRRNWTLKRRYGLTVEDYERLLAAQGRRCAACGSTSTNSGTASKHFDVDHDHDTGKVRGLLCRQCNALLGKLERNPRHVAQIYAYLAKYRTSRYPASVTDRL